MLRQKGYLREREVASAADAALAVSELVPAPYRQHVHAVLCFVRAQPLGGWARDVVIASTSTLPTMLRTRAQVLDASAMERVLATLASALPSASGAARAAVASASAASRRPDGRAAIKVGARRARRRRVESGRSVLLKLAVAFAFLLLATSGTLSTAAQWAGERLSDHLSEATEP